MPKISACILDLAEDMLQTAKNKSNRKIAITMACTAWNLAALSPKNFSQNDMDNIFEAGCDDNEVRDLMHEIMLSMIEKKKLLYPDDMHQMICVL